MSKLGINPQDVTAYLAFRIFGEHLRCSGQERSGIEPLSALTSRQSPEATDQLIADAEQSSLGEITDNDRRVAT